MALMLLPTRRDSTAAAENPEQLSTLIEEWVAAAPPVCKKDVESLLTWLVSPLGLPYLRAFACELRRATSTPPHAVVTGATADHSLPVNWSACWAWCVGHGVHWLCSDYRVLTTHLCLAGTVTSRRSPSARCRWLGTPWLALCTCSSSATTWRRIGRQSALSICTPTT